jgi:hypothetical protein
MSVACNELELTETPTILSSESVISFEVSNNILIHIEEYVFKDYGSLENLNLSESGIEQIDSRAFYGLKMLLNIDLSYNNLQFITPTIFSDTPFLQTVSFRGNYQVYVPDSSPIFVSPSIMSLDLSYCDLTSVNSHTFSQLPGLQVLDLYSNKLREFNRDILNTLTEISVIDFGNNLWKCDSNIAEVLNWLSTRRRSKGLLGEHNPVQCDDAGVLKTIWSSRSNNELCPEQAEMLPNAWVLKSPPTSLDSTTDPKFSTNLSPTSESKNKMNCNFTMDVVDFPYLCVLTISLTFILIIFFGIYKYMFSKVPLTLSSNSSEFPTKGQYWHSGVYSGNGSNTNDSACSSEMLNNGNGKKDAKKKN